MLNFKSNKTILAPQLGTNLESKGNKDLFALDQTKQKTIPPFSEKVKFEGDSNTSRFTHPAKITLTPLEEEMMKKAKDYEGNRSY